MSEIIITKLEFPETVRQNCGMYLGAVDDFTTPLREIINNSTDELINGHASWIRIVNRDTHKLVVDNGRGMPIYVDKDEPEKVIAHSAIGSLHAGSKIVDSLESTAGVHGVGGSAVNAVSQSYILMVRLTERNLPTTLKWIQEAAAKHSNPVLVIKYKKGLFNDEYVTEATELSKLCAGEIIPEDFSTAVYFEPDLEIYNSGKATVSLLPLRIVLKDFPSAKIFVNDKELTPFNYREQVAKGSELFLDKEIPFDFKFNPQLTVRGIISYDNREMAYSHVSLINLIETTQGGYIERRIATCLGIALSEMNSMLTVADAKLGLMVFSNSFTSYKLSFGSQTKEKLVRIGAPSVDRLVARFKSEGIPEDKINDEVNKYFLRENEFESKLTAYFRTLIKNNYDYFQAVVNRIIEYKRQMNRLSSIDFVKTQIVMGNESDRRRSSTIAAKVYEATSRDWARRELYVTEGLSASGGLIRCRNKLTQSVLPLRGKIANSTGMDEVDVVNSPELLALVNTIGCGIGSLSDVTKSRYGKIIIATDADSDGNHISNLILAVFLTHCPDLVKAGMLYKLLPPYYVAKRGNEVKYFDLHEKDKIDFKSYEVSKRKGLGSYTIEEVQQFMINEKTRRLQLIKYDESSSDLEEASTLLYSSAARKRLMIKRGVFSE